MERRAIAADGARAGRTIDAHVEVVGVAMPLGRLDHGAGGTLDDDRWRRTAPSLAQQAPLEMVGNEDVLHPGIAVSHELGNELPVAGVIEAEDPVRANATPVLVELGESERLVGTAPGVAHVERDVRIAPVLMRRVPRDATAALARKLANG